MESGCCEGYGRLFRSREFNGTELRKSRKRSLYVRQISQLISDGGIQTGILWKKDLGDSWQRLRGPWSRKSAWTAASSRYEAAAAYLPSREESIDEKASSLRLTRRLCRGKLAIFLWTRSQFAPTDFSFLATRRSNQARIPVTSASEAAGHDRGVW